MESVFVRLFNFIQLSPSNYRVETNDGKSAQESEQMKNVGTENKAVSATGSFSMA